MLYYDESVRDEMSPTVRCEEFFLFPSFSSVSPFGYPVKWGKTTQALIGTHSQSLYFEPKSLESHVLTVFTAVYPFFYPYRTVQYF